ncbi:hypothetical protein DID88_010263 [Monilinia fructigena]|uniref:Glycosyltransferase family 15 protein n=1 Tax=Monilinia fructigena TaxID=38457 RepID=A0A395IMS8_9HELO|nr:hypothetical protein DID88_010263 [Monilinia fructigena]
MDAKVPGLGGKLLKSTFVYLRYILFAFFGLAIVYFISSSSDQRLQTAQQVFTDKTNYHPRPSLGAHERNLCYFGTKFRHWEIARSIRQVEDRFNKKFHYDWVFLNDKPFDATFKKVTASLFPERLTMEDPRETLVIPRSYRYRKSPQGSRRNGTEEDHLRVKKFIKNHPEHIAEGNSMGFLSDDGGETYNHCHMWSNFEIGNLNWLRSKAYTDFFEQLDQDGGFFYERWGEQKRLDLKCHCNPKDNFDWKGYSCTSRFFDINKMVKPEGYENQQD